jgi:hypothetical protein
MTMYYFDLQGEDHTLFVFTCEASTQDEALLSKDHSYPEATILALETEDQRARRENERYRRLAFEQDYDLDVESYWD